MGIRPKYRSELGAQNRKINWLPLAWKLWNCNSRGICVQFDQICWHLITFVDVDGTATFTRTTPPTGSRVIWQRRRFSTCSSEGVSLVKLSTSGGATLPAVSDRALITKGTINKPKKTERWVNIPHKSKTRFYKLLAARTFISLLVGVIKVDNDAV